MNTINHYRKLLRIEQWYKNLLVFAPILFTSFSRSWPELVFAFAGFCAISSVTYIMNDWLDREKDRLHPTKRTRPLASGEISGAAAMAVGLLLLAISSAAAVHLGLFYGLTLVAYALITSLYSLGLKNVPVLDLLLISSNFLLRMLAGFALFPSVNDWPYFGFLFAINLVFLTHKRRSDIKLMGAEKAAAHKPVLRFYSLQLCYGIRLGAYVILAAAFFILFKTGWPLPQLALAVALLIYTSVLFSKEPALVIKPHHLLYKWTWVALALSLPLLRFIFP